MSRKLSPKLSWIYKRYNKIRNKKNLTEEQKSEIYAKLHRQAERKFKNGDDFFN